MQCLKAAKLHHNTYQYKPVYFIGFNHIKLNFFKSDVDIIRMVHIAFQHSTEKQNVSYQIVSL